MNHRLKEALRRKIDRHNRLVRLSTIGTALGVAAMWAIINFIGNWLPVLFLTVVKGLDAQAPASLPRLVVMGMMLWMVLGWLDRQLHKDEPEAHDLSFFDVAYRFLLLPPRATFAVFDNVRNRVALSEYELEEASSFIERLHHVGKIQMQSVPVELPNEQARDRILTALRIAELIREKEINKTDFLVLAHPERVAAFL